MNQQSIDQQTGQVTCGHSGSQQKSVSKGEYLANGSISEDDRYPGSFFRIPGLPAPGKTTWSLAK